jgi:hypothetical protein
MGLAEFGRKGEAKKIDLTPIRLWFADDQKIF